MKVGSLTRPVSSAFARVWRILRPPRRLRFTREGRYFVAIAIGIGAAAVNTGNNLLYLILGWMLSFIVASGVLSELTMRGLKVRRRSPPRIYADQPFLMEIAVENEKESMASYSIEIEDLDRGTPLDKKCFFLKVPPGRIQRTSYRHRFPRRGQYRLSGFRVGTKFPFALFRKSRILDHADDILVFPTVYSVATPAPRSRYADGNLVTQLGRSGEFFGLREYRQGDDRRDIHWRSTARSGRAMVREYEEESRKRVTLLIDNALPVRAGRAGQRANEAHKPSSDKGASGKNASGKNASGKAGGARFDKTEEDALEQAISLCASLASAYIRQDYAVRLLSRGVHVPFAGGEPQLVRILKALALLETVTDDTPFTALPNPRVESILIVPTGVSVQGGRPTQVSHVMQAS